MLQVEPQITLARLLTPAMEARGSIPGLHMSVLEPLVQDMEMTLVKSLHSGDPDMICLVCSCLAVNTQTFKCMMSIFKVEQHESANLHTSPSALEPRVI
jgi:hypothetical protein